MDLYLEKDGYGAMDIAEIMKTFGEFGHNMIARMQTKELPLLRSRLQIAYFIAKEELPLTKCAKNLGT